MIALMAIFFACILLIPLWPAFTFYAIVFVVLQVILNSFVKLLHGKR